MYCDGPPTSVVPVSMAAYEEDPGGKAMDPPLTFKAKRDNEHGEIQALQ